MLVGSDIIKHVVVPGRPVDTECCNLPRLSQAEMQDRFVLARVTGARIQPANLSHRPYAAARCNSNAHTHGHAIGFGAFEAQFEPVSLRKVLLHGIVLIAVAPIGDVQVEVAIPVDIGPRDSRRDG